MAEPATKDEHVTILLVEDNHDHAELVKRSLASHDLDNRIIHVSDGEAALDYLNRRGRFADAEQAPRPHLVLLDLRLPRIDGLTVLREIRASKHFATLPVVILTTSSAEKDVAKAYETHANSYIIKPLDFQKYLDLMHDLGLYWLNWNHYPWS